MVHIATAAACVFESDGKRPACVKCGRKIPAGASLETIARCKKANRPRTAEEIKATHHICRSCPHYLSKPTETLDAGVCLLRAKGCGACKSLEQFARYIAAGNPCPDGRFDGTPLVEPATPGQ